MKKTTQLRQMIQSKDLEFILEAHSGLAAKIVEEARFKGIWASGLSVSAALGVRDNNEASWTQVLEVLEFMSDATSIPILLDGDTGYGNFNNARRLIKKLEQRDVAGVCLEDKLFPKTNSFIDGESQPLADLNEFCGKLKAAKDAQADDDFVLVARVEAFIAGWGLKEALRRAEAYRKAGADAILIHSKVSNSSEIEAFMTEWGNRHPVVIVPTKYYSTPTNKFRDLGISLVIWANHLVRASITAMQKTAKTIASDESLINVEGSVASVGEIFRLQGAAELKEAEKKYLPVQGSDSNAIILAASQGSLGELTSEIPKTKLKVNGKPLYHHSIDIYRRIGINDITMVRGFKKEKLNDANINFIDNDEFSSTKELYSLYLAKDQIKENTIISYGDLLFKDYFIHELVNDNNDITLIVDANYGLENNADYVVTERKYDKKLYFNTVGLVEMTKKLDQSKACGEFIGIFKVNQKGAGLLKQALDEIAEHSDIKTATMADLFNLLVKKTAVAVKFMVGNWLDINSIVDLQKANEMSQ